MGMQKGVHGTQKRTRKSRNLTNSIDTAIDKFVLSCHNRNLTSNTIIFYSTKLNMFREYLNEHDHSLQTTDVTRDIIDNYIFYLKEIKQVRGNRKGCNPVSLNGTIAALKAFFKYLYDQVVILKNPTDNVRKLKIDKIPIIPFTEQQLKVLIRQPDRNTFNGLRDYIIMKVLLGTGIRLAELLNIKIADVDFDLNTILIKNSKNRHPRIVAIPKKLRTELKNFIDLCCKDCSEQDYVFQNQDYGQLKARTLQENIKEYGQTAGIANVRVSPHTFRHTFAINFLKNGGSTASLRQQLGHMSIETVEKYLYWSENDIIIEHEKYNPLDAMGL